MHEIGILLAQSVMMSFITAWLVTGVHENLFLPELNRTFTDQVLAMERLREDYPDVYADVAHRRIVNPDVAKLLFRLIVTWEVIATLVLLASTFALYLALFGFVDSQFARTLGIIGALFFTSIWAGFLVVGNWFCYWFCHGEAQNTHYQMTLWGIATMILLAVG